MEALEPRHLGKGAWVTSKIRLSPYTIARNLSFYVKGYKALLWGAPKLGHAGDPPLGKGWGTPDPYKHTPYTWVTMPKLNVVGYTVRAY